MLQYSDFTRLVNKVIDEGGFSINVNTGAIPGAGYMVSIPGAEEIRNIASFDYKDIKSYAARHAEQLAIPGAYLGGWIDGSEVYLDISINLDNLQAALDLARDNKQLAIFDLQAGESIYLDKQYPGRIEELYTDLDDYDYREYLERLWSEEYNSDRESRSLFHLEDKYQYYE